MSKKKSRPTHQSWHFITSLPFDECINRLETWRESGISMKISARSDESLSFNISYKQRFRQTLHANGTLQRWEGTHTRVDMNINLVTNIFSVMYLIPKVLPLVVLGIGICFCNFIIESSVMPVNIIGRHPHEPNPVFVAIIFCIIGIAFIGSFILWMATPEHAGSSQLTKLRIMLRNRLCEGDSSPLQYLAHEGRVETS
jgi:hypothetical protein